MTTNQIKYWELRWKQYYEFHFLQLKRQELELEIQKLQETKRSNRAKEQISWGELQERVRSNLVNEALKYDEAVRGHIKLNNEQIDLARKASELVFNRITTYADYKKAIEDAKNNWSVQYIDKLVNATGEFLKGFGGGAAAYAAGEARGMLASSQYDQLTKQFDILFPDLAEQYKSYFKPTVQEEPKVEKKDNPDFIGPPTREEYEMKRAKELTEKWQNRDDGKVLGFTGTQTGESSSKTRPTSPGQTSDLPGVSSYSGPTSYSQPTSSKVIYSGGAKQSNSGPGFSSPVMY